MSYFSHPLLRKNFLRFREYQEIISNSALNKNTLVILPTALGKTIISLLVSVNILYNYKKKRILILAPTRPLVNQHWDSFMSNLKLLDEQTVVVTGKIPPHARKVVWNNKTIRLFFSTPEVVKNDIVEKRLSLVDFFLVVFDEAHRAVKDYAYTFIADQYAKHCLNPLILGLTASPGSEKNKIQEICNNLFIENIEFKTEDDKDVKRYINPIDLKWQWFDLPSEYQYVKSILNTMLDEKLNWLSSRNILRKNSKWIFKRDLISLGEQLRSKLNITLGEDRRSIYYALMQQSIALSLMYCIELVESQGFHSLGTFLDRTRPDETKSHKILLEDNRIKEIKRLMENLQMEHPKVQYLLKVLKERNDTQPILNKRYNSSHNTSGLISRVLVFTQYRDTAQHIVEMLIKDNIRASKFVGQSKRQGDPGMKQEEQNSILRNFRDGEFSVLVATSIAEEGLDIPEVDLVVFYEPIPSEIRHIQRRGRTGRKNIGSVLILATKDTIDQRYLDITRKKIDKMKAIFSSTHIDLELKTLERTNLELDPMTKEEIEYLDSFLNSEKRTKIKTARAKNKILHEKIKTLTNDNSLVHFRKTVERTARKIYSLVSCRGNSGMEIELIHKTLGQENDLVIAGLQMLKKLRRIKIIGNKIILSENVEKVQGQTYDIEIEKVLLGKAIVLINGKWYASLHHYDYRGPRELIKKGKEFKAVGELYHNNDNLNLRVDQIL
ncbi:MAG TPA: helicase-related protein [Nitrososphaeraceae archaeon]|nr:helicase-related protein [Nitrososphaeraceae archaeon]